MCRAVSSKPARASWAFSVAANISLAARAIRFASDELCARVASSERDSSVSCVSTAAMVFSPGKRGRKPVHAVYDLCKLDVDGNNLARVGVPTREHRLQLVELTLEPFEIACAPIG